MFDAIVLSIANPLPFGKTWGPFLTPANNTAQP